MSTVKPDRLKGYIPKDKHVDPGLETHRARKDAGHLRGARGRPMLGENRQAPLLLHHLRPLALLLARAQRHLPAALRNDCATQEARVCAAIAELEAKAAKPRRPLARRSYRVTFPGAQPITIAGMAELGALVKRSASYVQSLVSRGGGTAQLPRAHPETGNPDYITIERLGTKTAPQQ